MSKRRARRIQLWLVVVTTALGVLTALVQLVGAMVSVAHH